MNLPLLLALLTASAAPLPDTASAQALVVRDSAAVVAVVQRFFDAMKVRDTATMRAQFHKDARFYGMRARPAGDSIVQVLTIDDFVGFVARDPRASWTERGFDHEVRVHRTLATVWAHYDFHFGSTFSHCGVDAVQLLHTRDGWKITSISDTYETAGCPRRPPLGGS